MVTCIGFLRVGLMMLLVLPFSSVVGFLSSSSSNSNSGSRRKRKMNRVAFATNTLNTLTATGSGIRTSTSTSRHMNTNKNDNPNRNMDMYKHTLAILTLPQTSIDRIANEAILETCMKHTTDKLSIVLRCADNNKPKLNELRGYVGEIYSMAWDVVLDVDVDVDVNDTADDSIGDIEQQQQESKDELLNVVIYPQNLPNAAPEAWITHRPDLECICSHSSIIGWVSSSVSSTSGNAKFFETVEGSGLGGLKSHVEAVNVDRVSRGLQEVDMLEVEAWPDVCRNKLSGVDDNVVFLEDDINDLNDANDYGNGSGIGSFTYNEKGGDGDTDENDSDNDTINFNNNGDISSDAVGHYRIPSSSLYNSVAVGGTWDGVHYGHRKLLTLAISSVVPNVGKLCIGITTDEMLKQKDFAELIPPLKERIRGVRNFVDALAPGMKNRIKIVPIVDAYGPPGASVAEGSKKNVYVGIENDFDALVLSHETLPTGNKLNQYRVETLGLEPLKLLCTRRTEAHGMSSTVLRKMRSQSRQSKSGLREKSQSSDEITDKVG